MWINYLRQFIISFQPCSNRHTFMEDNVQKSILVFMEVYCINVHNSMQAQCNKVRKVLQIYRVAIIAGTAMFVIPHQCYIYIYIYAFFAMQIPIKENTQIVL